MTIATVQPTPLDPWRRRFGGKRRRADSRPLAALGCLVSGPVIDGLAEVEKLTMVLLYDAVIRPGHYALRLAGYSASRIPWGVRFGGSENCQFFKDLLLQPVPQGRGYRLDLADTELLALGLGLDRELDRHARYRQQPAQEQIRLPKLWAAFRTEDAHTITGDGPELAAYAAKTGKSPQCLLQRLRRDRLDMTVYPLAWVSHRWQQAAAIFADLEQFPRRQVFHLRQPADDLVGFQGAAEFDFRGNGHAVPKQLQAAQSQPVLAAV
jgi:hypothetical protein